MPSIDAMLITLAGRGTRHGLRREQTARRRSRLARRWPKALGNAVDPAWARTKMGGPGAPVDLDTRTAAPVLAGRKRRPRCHGQRTLPTRAASPRGHRSRIPGRTRQHIGRANGRGTSSGLDHEITPEAMLRLVLNAMPRPLREILVLRKIEELSYHQISAVTALPIGTVMSRLVRARKAFGNTWRREMDAVR